MLAEGKLNFVREGVMQVTSVQNVGKELRCNKDVERKLSLEYVICSADQEIPNPCGS